MTASAAYHNQLMLYALSQLHRQNIMANIEIQALDFVTIDDAADNSQDRYTVAIEAKAHDQLVDTPTNSVIYTDFSSFIEYWTFVRGADNAWLLESIMQNTANPSMAEQSILQFAAANNFYYSLDMGRLFLPRRGQLVTSAQFANADVNNYCVGIWDNLLVQLYTISTTVDRGNAGDVTSHLMVAQINVPKEYGGIFVRPKKSLVSRVFGSGKPKGYEKYSMEWGDFNDKYDVYAEDQTRLATFELLNPGFMAYLYDADTNISLEVTDNIIYLYKPVNKVKAEEYQKFMTILAKTYKELRQ